MISETNKVYRADIERDLGPLDGEGRIPEGPMKFMKFSGFPWYLVVWYQEAPSYANETVGTCDDIGYYALFNTQDDSEWGVPEGVAGYIVSEDSQGFVYFQEYKDANALAREWQEVLEDDLRFKDENEEEDNENEV